jgi:uncharacterized membrane protein
MITNSKSTSLGHILLVITLLEVFTAPLTSVNADSTYKIIGKVVDESGHSIGSATVNVYTESNVMSGDGYIGEYVTTTKTDDYGNFTVKLDRMQYIFLFEKPGYQSTTLNVNLSVATKLSYTLNEVELKRSVNIVTASKGLEIHKGETLSIPLTIKNDGVAETDSINIVCGDGYSASVQNQAGQTVHSIYLSSSSTMSLTLEIDAPVNANDTDVVVKVAGFLETDYPIHLTVVESTGDIISCSYPSRDVKASDTIDFLITVKNPFYYLNSFTLNLVSPQSWDISMENEKGEKIDSVNLGGLETVTIHVTGTVSYDAVLGDYPLSLTATGGGLASTIPLSVSVKGGSEGLTITSKYPSQSVQLGKSTVYPIMIKNPGAEQLARLNVEGIPSGWKVTFMTTGTNAKQINSVLIGSSSYEDIDVEVTPSLDSQQGSFSFKVVASGLSRNGTITLNADVTGSYQVNISVDSLYFQTNVGETKTAVVTVTNTGYSPLNNLVLQLTSPDGWDVSSTPLKVTTLNPNEKAIFTVSIFNPQGTAPKDYLVSLQGVSDQVETSQQTIRITVNVESSWSIYGFLLLLVAVAGFALLYRKLRRK